MLLRELVVNDLAEIFQIIIQQKLKNNFKKSMKYHIECLARGELKKHNLHNIYPFIKILTKTYYDIMSSQVTKLVLVPLGE